MTEDELVCSGQHSYECDGKGLLLHTCPFAEDIHGDSDTLCTCCEACEHECLMEI